jgi:hypothetical protein
MRVCAQRLGGTPRVATFDDATPNSGTVVFVHDTAVPVELPDAAGAATGVRFYVMHPVLCLPNLLSIADDHRPVTKLLAPLPRRDAHEPAFLPPVAPRAAAHRRPRGRPTCWCPSRASTPLGRQPGRDPGGRTAKPPARGDPDEVCS